MKPLVIIDYGAGNLRSVQKAFERLGYKATVTANPKTIERAAALVFPGQGASPPAMAALKYTGLGSAVQESIAKGTPFFGICLGLQLLMEWSEEGETDCLGILPGTVQKFPEESLGFKVPHIGWNNVRILNNHPLFEDIPQNSFFYFVHSYYAVPSETTAILATTEYGVEFCSAATDGNIVATQFHPEKSGTLGLRLYDNFVRHLV